MERLAGCLPAETQMMMMKFDVTQASEVRRNPAVNLSWNRSRHTTTWRSIVMSCFC